MATLWQGLRYAAPTLVKRPGFTAIVILTLALGIGPNAAIISLVYAILLRPFPYREPDRLVRIQSMHTKTIGNALDCSLFDVEGSRKLDRTFEELGSSLTFDFDLVIEAESLFTHE